MTATLCLLGCLLAPARPAAPGPPTSPGRGEWVVGPRLGKGQELVYRGTFDEQAAGGGVEFKRAYRVETRVFVLEAPPKGADVAVLTVLKNREAAPGPAGGGDAPAGAVRLEVVHVDLQGKVTADPGVSLAVPLEGPPSLEYGVFVEVPDGKVAVGRGWTQAEDGRPAREWDVAGMETVNGVSCVKLVGEQKSKEWDQPRADRPAWRRVDTVWLAPRLGAAQRVERKVERRDPAHNEPTYQGVLRYELDEPMQYPGELFEQRELEVRQARAFADAAAPLLPAPAKNGPQFDALLKKISYHCEHHHETPYREAILQVKRRVEAAQRGEAPAAPPAEETPGAAAPAAVGAAAPDFTAPDLLAGGSAGLRRWPGKPLLLVFYSPASATSADVLRYAQKLAGLFPKDLTVVTLSMSPDAEAAKKQRDELNVSFPLLDGSGLRVSYGVDATPRLVLIDAKGVVRGAYTGWGRETPGEVLEELRRWAPNK